MSCVPDAEEIVDFLSMRDILRGTSKAQSRGSQSDESREGAR